GFPSACSACVAPPLERRDARPECFVRRYALLREFDDLRRLAFGKEAHHFLDDVGRDCLAPAHELSKLVFHVPYDLARTVGVTVLPRLPQSPRAYPPTDG